LAEETAFPDCSFVSAELAKFQEELRALRGADKGESAELQAAHRLLITYAESLNSTLNELHRANQELEDRVRERTRDLLKLNEDLEKEIRERARTEDWLRESEQRYRVLADQIPDVIFVLDESGKFTYVNHRVKGILGASMRAILGTSLAEYVTPEDRPKIAELLRMRPEAVWDEDLGLVDARGKSKFSRIRCRPFYDRVNGELRFEGVMRDITDRKRLEEELRASRQELLEKMGIIDDLYAHIIESCKAKAIGDHTAVVAHELRQPLAIIGGFARRTAKAVESCGERPRDAVRENLRIIAAEIQRLEKILTGLIEFTSSQGIQSSPVKLTALIDRVISLYRDFFREKLLAPSFLLHAKEVEISGDPLRLEQVVRNLLSIAVETCPVEGQMVIETRTMYPSLSAYEHAGLEAEEYFEFKVRCRGAHIDEKELQKVFSPFYSTARFGAGIGLILTKKIIEDHHGSISIHSDEAGLTFIVWLPVTQGE
jgi:PAS domain S-box-containing protein